jgi:hypothetical protein
MEKQMTSASAMRFWIVASAIGMLCLSSASVGAQSSSNWHVEIDPMTEIVQAMRQNYQQAGAAVATDAVSFIITRSINAANGLQNIESLKQKKLRTEKWERDLSGLLEDEGYESLSDDELSAHLGLTRAKFRAIVIQAQPFDRRDFTEAHTSQLLDLLVDRTSECTNSRGLIMAFVVGEYPDDNVAAQYGSVSVFLIAAGECAQEGAAIEALKNRIESSFVRAAEGD